MSDHGPSSWQQVVVEKHPSTMTPADVAQLGPPPRDLTPGLQTYVKRMKPSWATFWIFVAVLSVVSYGGLIASGAAITGLLSGSPWLIGSIAAAVWTSKRSKRGRAALRATLRDGQLQFARLVQNIQTQHGSGMSKKYRYNAIFDVGGRRVSFVTWNDAMSMINSGQLVEVVYNPASPDEIVPTFLLV
jgi:hypothetical protein